MGRRERGGECKGVGRRERGWECVKVGKCDGNVVGV